MSESSACPTCPTCRTVQRVCFWGPFKAAAWKRPALLFLAALVILGLLSLAVLVVAPSGATWQWFLVVPILGLAVLGLVVGVRGCEECVARVFGGI